MDKNQKKIMPGCEKLTRPEEISALKNYLKQGIQENESSLVIGDENPLMSTPGDPILGEIDLENQKLVMIDGSSVDIKRKSIDLDVSGDGNKAIPGNYLDKIQRGNSIDLSESRVNLELGDLKPKPSENLQKLNLENKEINTENKKINLDLGNNVDPEVGSYRESLSALSDKELSLFSFLSELPGESTEIKLDDQKRISLNEIKNKEPEEKKVLLEKDKEPELNSTLLEILENEVEPEEKKVLLEKNDDIDLSQTRVSLKKDKEPELNSTLLEILENIDFEVIQEIKHDLLENNVNPNVEDLETIRKNQRTPENDNSTWLNDNSTDQVNIPQFGEYKVSGISDSGENNITVWEDSGYKKNFIGDNNSEINIPQFGEHYKKVEDNKVDSEYTTWGSNNGFKFDVEHEDEKSYGRRDLGDNNLTDNSKLNAENLSKKTILDNNKLPNRTPADQKNLVGDKKAVSWKQLSSEDSNNVQRLDENGNNLDYSRNWIGDNNLKDDSEIPQFGEYYKKVEDNKVDSGYTTWGSNNVSHSLLFNGEDIISSEKDKAGRVIGFNSEGSKYTRKNLGDNYSTEDSNDRSEIFNFIETSDPKRLLDLNFDDGRLYKRLDSISDSNERDAWKRVYETLGNISDEYTDERGEKVHIGDGWKKELLEELLDKVSSYKNPSNVPNDAAGGNFSTWSSYKNTKFDSESFVYDESGNPSGRIDSGYSRNYLGDNNLSSDPEDSPLRKKIENNDKIIRPNNAISNNISSWKTSVGNSSFDYEHDDFTDSDRLNLGDNNLSSDSPEMEEKIERDGSRKERVKRPFHQNPYLNITVGEDGEKKVDLGSALSNPLSLFKSGGQGIVSGIGETLNTELSITPILRVLAETISLIPGIPADIKQDLIDTVLKYLVELRDTFKATQKIAPHRLPGGDSSFGQKILSGGSIKDVAKRLLEDTSGRGAPINRPSVDEFGNLKTSGWSSWGNDGVTKTHRYFSEYSFGQGIGLTLEDLCDKKTKPASLEDLKKLLSSSPYITTAENVKQRKMTLDSNHTWELRLFPFLGDINGNCSWLPNISEINSYNWEDHGVKTRWGDWLPVTSFELQSKKMTQKTLGLYDGEISYPISMEFSNEVRLTLVDDQYKSWKRYFELCAECSTYLTEMVNIPSNEVQYYKITENSNGLDSVSLSNEGKPYNEITEEDILSFANTTPIVKGVVCPGMYKNLTFRCLIYVMTPQMSTIQKFDLLLVLKDYSIEYSGETDASSPDLNISFSIVGENPMEDIPKRGTPLAFSEKNYKSEGFFEKIGNDIKSLGNWKNSLGGVMDILS